MEPHYKCVTRSGNRPAAGAQITVRKDGALATIYSDDGVTVQANPITAGSDGCFQFYAADGKYDVTISGNGIVTKTYSVLLEDQIASYSAVDAKATAAQATANAAVPSATLAATGGSALVGHGSDTVASVLDALHLADYAALRAYTGNRQSVYVTGYLASAAPSGIAGLFTLDSSDTTTSDNGGTVIVAANGKRWKRRYSGAADVRWFGASPTAAATVNTAAFNAALAACPFVAAGRNEVYPVNGQINVAAAVHFDGNGCTLSATMAVGGKLLNVTASASLKNLTLDFNNGYALSAIHFPTANVGYLELVNVAVKNIHDIDTTSLTFVIKFNADRNELRLDGVSLSSIKKRSDGNSTSIGGGIEGIYVFAETAGAVGGGGYMRNITLDNIRTVDAAGADAVDAEDICNAIYFAFAPATDRRARIAVDNVRALDFGRRLFKTQCDDLQISNVFAESNTLPAFVALGIQDYDTSKAYNVKVKDAIIRGKMRYGAAISADDVLLDGIDIDISLAGTNSPYGNNAFGVGIAGDNLTISNSFISAKIGLYGSRVSANFAGIIKGLLVENTKFKTKESGAQFFDIGSATSMASVDSAMFNSVVFDASSFPAAAAVIGNTTNLSNVVKFANCLMIDNDAAANGGSYIHVDGVKAASVSGYTHLNSNATSLVLRSLRFRYCTSVMLSGINLQAKPNAASLSVENTAKLTVNGLHVDPASTYSASITATTESRFANTDRSKVIFNDTSSNKGARFSPEFSSGATSLRPDSSLVSGQQYFDTTLGKPIWWNGSVWKDAAGATV